VVGLSTATASDWAASCYSILASTLAQVKSAWKRCYGSPEELTNIANGKFSFAPTPPIPYHISPFQIHFLFPLFHGRLSIFLLNGESVIVILGFSVAQ